MENLTELFAGIMGRLDDLAARLDRIEQRQSVAVVKEGYTPGEVAERLKKSAWTVAQWCNLGSVMAKKVRGRGPDGEWRISHEELVRLQADGPMPEGTFQNRTTRRAS